MTPTPAPMRSHLRWLRTFLGLCLTTGLHSGNTLAATITVTSLADDTNTDGQVTLREAIEAANLDVSVDGSTAGSGSDQIVFATGPGAIVLNGTRFPTLVEGLTISGLGASQLTLAAGDQSRVFEIAPGVTADISGITIAGGRSTDEGGALRNHGTLTLSNCILTGNATVTDGGAIFNDGTLTVSNSTFSGNSAQNGGSLYNNGTATLMNSTLSGNFTGGIAPFAGGGGAILNQGSLTIVASTLSGNTAGNGGALVNTLGGSLTLANATISGNQALNNGGGISSFASTLVIESATIAGNRSNLDGDAIGQGGGLSVSSIPATLHNTLVAGNFNGTGSVASDFMGIADAASSSNLIGVDSGLSGISDGANGNIIGTEAAPVDPLLGPLSNNGGSTLTHALSTGSPAVDVGNDGLCPATDQRGASRPHDGDGDGLASCDIGAFEVASCQGDGTFRLSGRATRTFRRRLTPPGSFRNLAIRLLGQGCADSLTTDSQGKFQFDDLLDGSYTVFPTGTSCRFKRPSWTVGIAGRNQTVVFVGVCP